MDVLVENMFISFASKSAMYVVWKTGNSYVKLLDVKGQSCKKVMISFHSHI